MPEVDLSSLIPPEARWLKVRYQMSAAKQDTQLIARLWSGNLDKAVVIKGPDGDAFVQLEVPQKISYQRPVGVELKLKVIAYKTAAASAGQ
jgi:hypothetical protein